MNTQTTRFNMSPKGTKATMEAMSHKCSMRANLFQKESTGTESDMQFNNGLATAIKFRAIGFFGIIKKLAAKIFHNTEQRKTDKKECVKELLQISTKLDPDQVHTENASFSKLNYSKTITCKKEELKEIIFGSDVKFYTKRQSGIYSVATKTEPAQNKVTASTQFLVKRKHENQYEVSPLTNNKIDRAKITKKYLTLSFNPPKLLNEHFVQHGLTLYQYTGKTSLDENNLQDKLMKNSKQFVVVKKFPNAANMLTWKKNAEETINEQKGAAQ